jgi:hypothetical protein
LESTVAVVTAATAETLATVGAPGTSTAVRTTTAVRTATAAGVRQQQQSHYNNWDPRKANDSNKLGHKSVAIAETVGLIWDASNSSTYSTRNTSNNRVASNFHNLDASKMLSFFEKNEIKNKKFRKINFPVR